MCCLRTIKASYGPIRLLYSADMSAVAELVHEDTVDVCRNRSAALKVLILLSINSEVL